MKTATKNPHGWLFRYLSNTYPADEAADIRKAMVKQFSDGKTESLKELYEKHPRAYMKMQTSVKEMKKESNSRPNKQRRKLLSLIYEFSKLKGYQCPPQNAISIACIACNVQHLNDATEQKLIAAIKSFESKEADAWVSSVLDNIAKL